MKRFKLVRYVIAYEHAYVQAETREEAQRMYDDDDEREWKHDEYGDSTLIAVDECVEDGDDILSDIGDDGKFVEKE